MSCATIKENKHEKSMILPQEEYDKFSNKADTIYYDMRPVGIIQNVEWEYIPGNDMRMEISVSLANRYEDAMTSKIIKYVHSKYKEAKVEINCDE